MSSIRLLPRVAAPMVMIATALAAGTAPREASTEPSAGFASTAPFRLIREASAYPRVTELKDGALLCGIEETLPDGRAIGVVRSLDGGQTWGDLRRITSDRGRVDLANVFPLQSRMGEVVVAYRHHRLDEKSFSLRLAASADGGQTWSERSTIASGKEGLWEPFLLERSDGTLQAYYASEEGAKPYQRIEMVASQDGGRTWGEPVNVAAARGSRDGMPGVVSLQGSELLVVFEAQDVPGVRFAIRSVRSADGGSTWSPERGLVYQPRNARSAPWAAGAPSLVRASDGSLLVSFQTDEDVIFREGHPAGDPRLSGYDYLRHCTFKVVSGDSAGHTWGEPLVVDGGPERSALWNALYSLRDGTVLALSGQDGKVWCRRGTLQ